MPSYDNVLSIDPSHWRSLLNKAVVQTCTGDKDEAAAHLKQALKLSGAAQKALTHLRACARGVFAAVQVQRGGG